MLDHQIPLPPLREGRPAASALAERRAAMASSYPVYPVDDGATVEEIRLADVSALAVSGKAPWATMLYFHGGGFRSGSPQFVAGFLSRVAVAAGVRVVAAAYSLAPERPFPAAIHDGAHMLEALANEGDAPLLVGGDSAGGGLAATLTANVARGLAGRLAGAVLLSPWLDLTVTAETYQSCSATDRLFSSASALEAAELYLQGASARDPLASPLFADLSHMPPTMILAGAAEVLLDDSLSFAGLLARRNRTVELYVVEDMQHVSPVLYPDLPSTPKCVSAIAAFLTRLRLLT
jgi:acetyl esterase/lipase